MGSTAGGLFGQSQNTGGSLCFQMLEGKGKGGKLSGPSTGGGLFGQSQNNGGSLFFQMPKGKGKGKGGKLSGPSTGGGLFGYQGSGVGLSEHRPWELPCCCLGCLCWFFC